MHSHQSKVSSQLSHFLKQPLSYLEELQSLPKQELDMPLHQASDVTHIDLLVGAGYYWDIVCGQPTELPSGVCLLCT